MNTRAKQLNAPLWRKRRGEVGGGGGGSSGSFARTGTGVHERTYAIPSDINALITNAAKGATTDPSLATNQITLFNNLMQGAQSASSQPGFSQLSRFAETDPLAYSGRAALTAAANRNPYDGAYARDTAEQYRQNAGDAMAQVATGPAAVRGGDARTGIMQGVAAERLAAGRGQEVRQAQLQDVASVITAAQGMGNIENTRLAGSIQSAMGLNDITNSVANRGLAAGQAVDTNKLQNLSLLQLASQLQGSTVDTQTDNFKGKGDQGGWQAGLSCCFIFNEALNGELPWYIELARFDYLTVDRYRGYKWMAKWLVPAMRTWRVVRHVVNAVMVKPFLVYGGWLYGETNRHGWALAPWCHAWLRLWGWLGRTYGR